MKGLLIAFLLSVCVGLLLLSVTALISNDFKKNFVNDEFDNRVFYPFIWMIVAVTFVVTNISFQGNIEQAKKDFDPAAVFVNWDDLQIGVRRIGKDKVDYRYCTERYELSLNNRSDIEETDTSKKNNNIIQENDVLYATADTIGGFMYTFRIEKGKDGKIVSEYIR